MMTLQFLLIKMLVESIAEQHYYEDEAETERITAIENEDLEEDEMADDAYDPFESPYPDQERELGAGPCRLNTTIEVREDTYSYIFALSFHPDYIYYCDKSNNDKTDIMSKLREEAKKSDFDQHIPYGVLVRKDVRP